MNHFFSSLPNVILKRFLIQTGLGLCAVILFAILMICIGDFILSLPCLIMAIFLFWNAVSLVIAQRRGNILCVHGTCVKLGKGLFRKQNKAIYLESELGTIKVIAYKAPKRITVGESLDLYLKKSVHIYERDGEFTVSEYVALARPDAN